MVRLRPWKPGLNENLIFIAINKLDFGLDGDRLPNTKPDCQIKVEMIKQCKVGTFLIIIMSQIIILSRSIEAFSTKSHNLNDV